MINKKLRVESDEGVFCFEGEIRHSIQDGHLAILGLVAAQEVDVIITFAAGTWSLVQNVGLSARFERKSS